MSLRGRRWPRQPRKLAAWVNDKIPTRAVVIMPKQAPPALGKKGRTRRRMWLNKSRVQPKQGVQASAAAGRGVAGLEPVPLALVDADMPPLAEAAAVRSAARAAQE